MSIFGKSSWPPSLTPAQAVLTHPSSALDIGAVTYEIHLHPTYRVPCLWFNLRNLPPDEPEFSIDTVFRRLVPEEFKQGLRGLGGIGGISADVSKPLLAFLADSLDGALVS